MRRLTVEAGVDGLRLDRWLVTRLAGLSRGRLQTLIDGGYVRVDGAVRKAAHRLGGGEQVDVEVPPPPAQELAPEATPLAVVYEDEHVLVVDKPAGMVVHPGAGHATGTLAAAALSHAPSLGSVGGARRPGIVHRLDKDTSGLLVLAKSQLAYDALTAQLADRAVSRRYLAVVHGSLGPAEGVIDKPIARHPYHRTRMAVAAKGKGKRAVTHYRVLERFSQFTSVDVRLDTGRTHQIRVHFASLGHPVAGDDVYGDRKAALPVALDGYALHAAALAFVHPATQKRLEFGSDIPPRIEQLLSHLRNTA
ncbi:MAG TPA: RluA family pseudouridine synthase [Candidatus Limnocylindria bacterium]|nr:RluA family pseudouridine synthase [Candidatus Limnocylindria bacterium]